MTEASGPLTKYQIPMVIKPCQLLLLKIIHYITRNLLRLRKQRMVETSTQTMVEMSTQTELTEVVEEGAAVSYKFMSTQIEDLQHNISVA